MEVTGMSEKKIGILQLFLHLDSRRHAFSIQLLIFNEFFEKIASLNHFYHRQFKKDEAL